MAAPAVAGPPGRATLDDVAHPEQRFDIVDQRRPAEQADPERQRRLVARQAAPALERVEQRRFLAADIGAGATTQVDGRPARRQARDLALENGAGDRILVAQVEIDRVRPHHMGADQHALEEAMRVRFKVKPVLEGAGLALVGVHHHQARAGFGPHGAPFAGGGKAGTAEPAQGRVVEAGEDRVGSERAVPQATEQPIAAAGPVGVGVDIGWQPRAGFTGGQRGGDRGRCGRRDGVVADGNGRRVVALAHAGRADDAQPRSGKTLEVSEQRSGAGHRAGQALAGPHGQRRQGRFVVLQHVEMGVEGRGLEHVGQRQPHRLGQRGQHRCRDAAMAVLDQVQVLDKQVSPQGTVTQQGLQVGECGWVGLAALGGSARLAAAPTGRLHHRP